MALQNYKDDCSNNGCEFHLLVKIISASGNLPQYKTIGSAGMDLQACIENPIVISPHKRKLIPTGLRIQLPYGYEAQIRPRSGLALKNGITVLNSPGTIDSDYTGEIGVVLYNSSDSAFTVRDGDRIAQMVIAKYEKIIWLTVDELEPTQRGEGGFGHTGI